MEYSLHHLLLSHMHFGIESVHGLCNMLENARSSV
jgi:hypothetical protein